MKTKPPKLRHVWGILYHGRMLRDMCDEDLHFRARHSAENYIVSQGLAREQARIVKIIRTIEE